MRQKYLTTVRLLLALVFVCSLVIVVAAPAGADVTAATVTPTPATASDAASYTVAFNVGAAGALTANVDLIYLQFPSDTTVPSSIGKLQVTVNGTQLGVDAFGNLTFIGLTTPVSVANNGAVTAVFSQAAGIINPTTPSTTYKLKVSTSIEGTQVDSNNYTITSDTTPPAAVTDLRIDTGNDTAVTLKWTAPGDDGNAGTATTYDIRYHTSGITEANWNAATQCNGEPSPQSAGNGETFTVNGLNAGTHYWFALKTADEVPNWSGLSDVPSGQWMSVNQVQFSDSLNGVDVTFDSVTQAGLTKVDPSTNNPCGEVQDFRFLGKFYHITTTAIYSGNVTVTIGYNPGDLQGKEKEDEIDIFRCENGWVDVTTSRDTGKNTVTAVIPKLCFFGLAPAAPMCFIATAAYGSYLDSHVQTLRDFRDTYLVTNPVGSSLVSTYYKLSPPIAEFIDDHPSLKPIVRVGLMPAVALSTVAVNTTLAEKMAIAASMLLFTALVVVWVRRRAVKSRL